MIACFMGLCYSKYREEDFPTLPKPVIYISIGTILKGAERFFRVCVKAFEKEPVTVVLSVGGHFDISKLEPLPKNFIVRNHVPQITVLKQADIFITHGGMNSVSEAMALGVPMLVIPFVSDQPVNAAQVQRLGLGRVLCYQKITAGELQEAAFSVLEDGNILKMLKI